METYDKVDLKGLEQYQSALKDKLKGIGEWREVINTIGNEHLNSQSDFDDLLKFEGKFTSALEFISERIKSKKGSFKKSTSVNSSVKPKVKEASSTDISTEVDKNVDNLAAQVMVLDLSTQGEVKWKKLPHIAIKMEESDSETEPKPVPKKRTHIPKTFRDFSTQTDV